MLLSVKQLSVPAPSLLVSRLFHRLVLPLSFLLLLLPHLVDLFRVDREDQLPYIRLPLYEEDSIAVMARE